MFYFAPMRFDYDDEQKAFRDGLRAYFAEHLTPERRAQLGPRPGEHCGPAYRAWIRQMGSDGWLGVGWPTEYGGQGRSIVEEYIFLDECRRADAPLPLVTLNTVGPTLMEHGSEEQRKEFLPRILRGEIHFAIGYTEPASGTDLASLRTRAVRDGGHYVITGQKIFTTGAHDADYVWLAARTDPTAPKHKGLSIFIVPTDTLGFTTSPIHTLDDGMTNACYFEDVRVPLGALVGAENEGWRLITTQLNHERVALACSGRIESALDDTIGWARETGALETPWVRAALAEVRAKVDALRLLNHRMAWAMSTARLNPADASVVKVYGTEMMVACYRTLLEVVGTAGLLSGDVAGSALKGRLDESSRWALVLTFGGGVNEIQREIIAVAGLGMPRSPR